jgi:hypothetical protein
LAQFATYEVLTKLKKAIGFLENECAMQISDIAKKMPINLGNLSTYLKLGPNDDLPKKKTLENHYEHLKLKFKKELKPLWQKEKKAAKKATKVTDQSFDGKYASKSLEKRVSKLEIIVNQLLMEKQGKASTETGGAGPADAGVVQNP